jgi:hypothetical protein
MPITFSGQISLEDHVLPVLREAGFTVKADRPDGFPFWYIEPYTSIGLHLGKQVKLRGPAAEAAGKVLLEKCRPYGDEIEIEVTKGPTVNMCPSGLFHDSKRANRWNPFSSKMVCTRCGYVWYDYETC